MMLSIFDALLQISVAVAYYGAFVSVRLYVYMCVCLCAHADMYVCLSGSFS